ncbi:unnamed protein product, partial [Rotaria sp. Silwood2]
IAMAMFPFLDTLLHLYTDKYEYPREKLIVLAHWTFLKIKIHKLNNVEIILGSTTDPKLPENTLATVIILNAYYKFEKPITMLTKIRQVMKVGARLSILDRDNDQMRNDAREAYTETEYILHCIKEILADNYLTTNHYLELNIVVREATLIGFTFLFLSV